MNENTSKEKSLKVALVSFPFESDMERNLLKIESEVKKAYMKGSKLVCFPECTLTGLPSEEYERDIKMAIEIPGSITRRISQISKVYGVYIAIGLLEKKEEKIYDTAVLFDSFGKIILKYRRINSQWRSRNAPGDLYVDGKDIGTCSTPLGKLAFAICGDIFDDKVVKKIKKVKPDYLIVPMWRSFGPDCRDVNDWEEKEKWVYARQVAKLGVTTFLINEYEGEQGSFGGSLIISGDGKILAENDIGKPSTLFHELPILKGIEVKQD